MGSGIAAHLANLGFDVSLLDLTTESTRAGFDRATQAKPPHFYRKSTAENIKLGNLDEHEQYIADADWVCEAIIENLAAKQALYERIEPLIGKDSLISTNTSGLEITLLKEGRSNEFRRKFLGTHFFNPPRYLKLLELIPTDETDPEVVASTINFLEKLCARRVVLAKDTPGFIANRFGMWSMFHTVHVAEKMGMSVEETDAICGSFLGRPNSAAFRLNDLVGLDIMADIASNLQARCTNDPTVADVLALPESLSFLLNKGWIGNKAGQGYYRKEGHGYLSFDLITKAYRENLPADYPQLAALAPLPIGERLRAAIAERSDIGEFLRRYLIPTLKYANSIKEEISHSVQDFDRVMQWGFGWQLGPFALIDAIGADALDIQSKPFYQAATYLDYSGTYVTPKPEPEYLTIQEYPTIEDKESVRLVDLGDGVHALSIKSKMGIVSPSVVDDMLDFIESGKFSGGVITSEAKVFSVGFDIKFLQQCIETQDFAGMERGLKRLQKLTSVLQTLPTIAACSGYCLGGGYEVALGCSHIVAQIDCQIGLPEAGIGLIPGGGGTAILRQRWQHDLAKLQGVTIAIAQGKRFANADEAKKAGFLLETDKVEYHPDRTLYTAKMMARAAVPKAVSTWDELSGPYKGMVDRAQDELLKKGEITNYDKQINDKVKHIFATATSYDHCLEIERDAFIALAQEGLTQARIRHMLENGKPLKN